VDVGAAREIDGVGGRGDEVAMISWPLYVVWVTGKGRHGAGVSWEGGYAYRPGKTNIDGQNTSYDERCMIGVLSVAFVGLVHIFR
jgi:hypothetical protein